MKKIYIVLCDGFVSQEAYDSFEKARDFILGRTDHPKPMEEYRWVFNSPKHMYGIREVTVC